MGAYEAFHDDAVTLARELDLTLTARDKQQGSLSRWPASLTTRSRATSVDSWRRHHVAVCDQLEHLGRGSSSCREG